MAERRMFAKTIIDSDAFLDMPLSTQALYFHLAMRADDEGFVNNPKKIQRMVSASEDDLKVLATKRFIIPFESGVVVIRHWKIHNYIQNDRKHDTVCEDEKSLITVKKNGEYEMYTDCIQNGYNLDTEVSIGKDSIVEDSIGKSRLDEVSKEESINNSFYEVSIPIRGGGEWIPKEEDIQSWRLAFPHISVVGELFRIKVWFDANPDRRKQPKEIKRFVVGWLDRTERETNEKVNARQQAPQEQEEECSNPFLQMLLEERKKQ